MSGFTPGPWQAIPLEGGKRGSGAQWMVTRKNTPARPIFAGLPRGDEEQAANVRLIAAAPELYEACRKFLALRQWVIDVGGTEGSLPQSIIEEFAIIQNETVEYAKAALRKADGQ